ncbi:cytochrome c biogenesis CcdA family protein [Eubacterium multiforme]|uniref:Cytochrome c-type biogenesis protein n=1 Tax=Eubacterium multiforme TaxID=83339 RepID=A0ABT9USP4_9FIRM|nr:cytochrome c biogenesis protein CcdA [Eubacterium multiforme]MDQ0149325.1 cytochrome c-type biogenesis protein [Eubacterium multiforme]
MRDITIFIAFFSGLVSFLSPCVLPLIPAYVSILADEDENLKRNKVLSQSLLFILGFTIIFIIMGASGALIGRLFGENIKFFRVLAGIIIIIFGLQTAEIIKIKFLYREKRFSKRIKEFGPIVMGMAFAAGWTPCIGPILGSILLYASSQSEVVTGIVMLLFYSLGMGVPFLITAILIEKFDFVRKKIYKYMVPIKKISGIFMIIIGLLMVTNKLLVVIGLLT